MSFRKIEILISVVIFFAFSLVTTGNNLNNIKFLSAESISDSLEAIDNHITIANRLATIDEEISLAAVKKARFLSENVKNLNYVAICDHIEGNILVTNGKAKEGIVKLKRALSFFESVGDETRSNNILLDIGKAYQTDNSHDKALVYFNSALSNFKNPVDSIGILKSRYLIGKSYAFQNNIKESISYYLSSLHVAELISNIEYQLKNKIQLTYNYEEFDSLQTTVSDLSNIISICKEIENLELELEAQKALVDYHSRNGNSKLAVAEMSRVIDLYEKITNQRFVEAEKLMSEISVINTPENKNDNSTVIFIIALVVLLSPLIYLFQKNRKNKAEHKLRIERCQAEIEAFKANLTDLDEKTRQISKERLSEIENEISKNRLLKTAITNSQHSLNNVNSLKDKFLSKISHEIRTPLSGILGFAEILENQLALEEENDLFDYAKSITDSGLSLVNLLNNLLDISRLNSNSVKLEISKQELPLLIQPVIDKYSAEAKLKGLKLIFETNDIPDIYTDNALLSKVISLVLSNAVKFTEKGYIKISTKVLEKGDVVIITIKDTGIGIDEIYMDQVFEPYRQESLGYSTSYQGAGLGLPLAKKMTTRLGGKIKLESEISIGTTVTISIPIGVSNEVPSEKTHKIDGSKDFVNDKISVPWNTLKILVVEDDNMNQLLYTKILKTSKQLEIAKDGKQALDLIEEATKTDIFDIVLMDINLPSPWTGITLMQEIRRRWPEYINVPFIAQTAYAISGNRSQMLEVGFDEYINKPILKSGLISVFNAALSK